MDLVSVITTSYNSAMYIDDCLSSIDVLNYPCIELLIIDDSSIDGTWEKIKRFYSKNKNRYTNFVIKQTDARIGFANCVNELIKMSKGKYIKKVDSDDMITKYAIDSFMEIANKVDADVYFSNGYLIDEKFRFSEIKNAKSLKKRYDKRQIDGNDILSELCSSCYISNPGTFFPRKTFEKFGLYNSDYISEDYEYWLRISTRGAIFKYIDEPTFYYRELNSSLSHFGKTSNERKRLYLFEVSKYSLLKKYINYANNDQKFKILNTALSYSISNSDCDRVNEVLNSIKNYNVKISIKNKIKYLVYKLKLMKLYIYFCDIIFNK